MPAPDPVPAAEPAHLEITQDHEYTDDEFGGPLPVFWAKGHGHDPLAFIRAVVDYCLDNGADIPAIEDGLLPEETWQQNLSLRDGVEYRRDPEPPTSPRSSRFPVTVLDLESPRRSGGTKCGVDGCDEPYSVGTPIRVLIEPGMGEPELGAPRLFLRVWLCREHHRRFPEPSYRVCMIPVGAEVVLPAVSRD